MFFRVVGSVGGMAQERPTGDSGSEWLYMPLIFGVLFGVVISSMTGQWWWVAVGTALGAAVGAARAGRSTRSGSSEDET